GNARQATQMPTAMSSSRFVEVESKALLFRLVNSAFGCGAESRMQTPFARKRLFYTRPELPTHFRPIGPNPQPRHSTRPFPQSLHGVCARDQVRPYRYNADFPTLGILP